MALNSFDVISFRVVLLFSALLAQQCHHKNHTKNVSFSFHINDKADYIGRSKELDFLTAPTKPKAQAGIALIHQKFPKMLMDKVDKRSKALEAKMAARQACEHIEKSCRRSFRKSTHDEMMLIRLEKECQKASEGAGTNMEAFKVFWVRRRLTDIESTKEHKEKMDNMRADAAYLILNKWEIVVSAFNDSVQEPHTHTSTLGEPPEWAAALTVQVAALQAAVYSWSDASTITTHSLNSAYYSYISSNALDHITATNVRRLTLRRATIKKTTLDELNPQATNTGVCVGCTNGSTMVAVAIDVLNLWELPLEARGCQKFDEVQFGGSRVTMANASGSTVLEGHKDPRKNLPVPLHRQLGSADPPRVVPWYPAGSPRVVLRKKVTSHSAYEIQSVINYLHAVGGLPVQATWAKEIAKNFYTPWPGLTKQRVEYYLNKSEHIIKGHLGLVRTIKDLAHDKYTKQLCSNKRSVTAGVVSTEELKAALGEHRTISCDLPGTFSTESARGPHCVFLMYDFDTTSYIMATPIKSRDAEDFVMGFKVWYDDMKEHGTVT
eukprot:jgi/Psemu1/33943/gm1.33943_g